MAIPPAVPSVVVQWHPDSPRRYNQKDARLVFRSAHTLALNNYLTVLNMKYGGAGARAYGELQQQLQAILRLPDPLPLVPNVPRVQVLEAQTPDGLWRVGLVYGIQETLKRRKSKPEQVRGAFCTLLCMGAEITPVIDVVFRQYLRINEE